MSAIIHIALGSNRRHGRHGNPAAVVAAATLALAQAGLPVVARSTIRPTPPLGPRQRRFANAVVAVATHRPLPEILKLLQAIERDFGRRPGRRWGPRILDLDIVAAGAAVTPAAGWRTAHRGLIVPHRGVASRRFVLDPLVELAGDWRHPVLHLTARQLRVRLRRPRRAAIGDP
jgi:2-amino-4-hydroxy-6-hydroxymethyldihydropteridine diphosphokinase